MEQKAQPLGKEIWLPCISTGESPQPFRQQVSPSSKTQNKTQCTWHLLADIFPNRRSSPTARGSAPSVNTTGHKGGKQGVKEASRGRKRWCEAGGHAKTLSGIQFGWDPGRGWPGEACGGRQQTGGRLWKALPTMSNLDDLPGAMGSYWRILSNKRHNQIWVF